MAGHQNRQCYLRLSFEPRSSNRFVINTNPTIWVHSETMLPTTCPHFELAFMERNSMIHAMPVTSRKMVRE